MTSPTEYWERYALGQEIVHGSHPTNDAKGLQKRAFMAALKLVEELAEREIAFIKIHEDLQQRSLHLQVENIQLRTDLNGVRADLQRMVTLFEDQEG